MKRRFTLRFLFLFVAILCVSFALMRLDVHIQGGLLLLAVVIVFASPLSDHAKGRIIWGAVGGAVLVAIAVGLIATPHFPMFGPKAHPVIAELWRHLAIPVGGVFGGLDGFWLAYGRRRGEANTSPNNITTGDGCCGEEADSAYSTD
jgi:hypothetical protein